MTVEIAVEPIPPVAGYTHEASVTDGEVLVATIKGRTEDEARFLATSVAVMGSLACSPITEILQQDARS